jgi:ketosteroid isomerase-like protein
MLSPRARVGWDLEFDRACTVERLMNTEELCSRLAIQDLTNRYALYVDTKQLDRLVDLFWSDAVFDESALGAGPFHGQSTIREYFQVALPSVSELMHITSNLVIDFDTGSDAKGVSTLFFEGKDPTGKLQRLKGYFHDIYRRSSDQWRFQSRMRKLI